MKALVIFVSIVLPVMLEPIIKREGAFDSFEKDMIKCFNKWNTMQDVDNANDAVTVKTLHMIESIIKLTIGEQHLQTKIVGEVKLAQFIFHNYRLVPYHNICHGIIVAFYTSQFLDKTAGKHINMENEDPLYPVANQKAMIFGALLHDIGHPGYTNPTCFDKDSTFFPSKLTKFCSLKAAGGKDKCEYAASENQPHFKFSDLIGDKQALIGLVSKIKDIFIPNFINDEDKAVHIFHEKFCGSAELQHAIAAHEILKKLNLLGNAGNPFVNHVITPILLTHLGFYDFLTGVPLATFKTAENHPDGIDVHPMELVHFSDLFGIIEKDKDLRFKMLSMLVYEFKKEGDLTGNMYKDKLVNFGAFMDFQKDFVKDFVERHVAKYEAANGPQNELFGEMVAVLNTHKYTDYKAIGEHEDNTTREMRTKFTAAYKNGINAYLAAYRRNLADDKRII